MISMRLHCVAVIFALPLLSGCIAVPAPYTMKASGIFHGRVLDGQSMSPVAGATVEVTGYPKTARTTGRSGDFTVGPARKWYGYFVIGMHQHAIPEPEPPDIVTSITVRHPSFWQVTKDAGGTSKDRDSVKQRFELGDIQLQQSLPTKR